MNDMTQDRQTRALLPDIESVSDRRPSLAPVIEAATKEAAVAGAAARHWIDGTRETLQREARAVEVGTRRYVRDEPMKSLALAATAGALVTGLVGWLFSRKR